MGQHLQQQIHESILRVFAEHVDMKDTKKMDKLFFTIQSESETIVKFIKARLLGVEK